jgi:CspA family cold shock protein
MRKCVKIDSETDLKTPHIIEYNTMSTDASVVTPSLVLSSDRSTGRVKWFNNKAGYGFISVVSNDATSDLFVHHSNLVVSSEQYKYLVEGEYVEFTLVHTPGKDHEYQAGDVSGINGGKLMCETRRENRQNRFEYSASKKPDEQVEVKQPVQSAPRSRKPPSAPRIEDEGDWVLAAKKGVKPQDKKPRGRPAKSANL